VKYSVCCEEKAIVFVQPFIENTGRKAEILRGRMCSKCRQWLEINEIQRHSRLGWRRVRTSQHLTKWGKRLLKLDPTVYQGRATTKEIA